MTQQTEPFRQETHSHSLPKLELISQQTGPPKTKENVSRQTRLKKTPVARRNTSQTKTNLGAQLIQEEHSHLIRSHTVRLHVRLFVRVVRIKRLAVDRRPDQLYLVRYSRRKQRVPRLGLWNKPQV
jgi:hypothetical protein